LHPARLGEISSFGESSLLEKTAYPVLSLAADFSLAVLIRNPMSNSMFHFKNKLFLLTALAGLLIPLCEMTTPAQQPAVTTVILVRHAEKKNEPENKDPDLSLPGLARARELVRMFGGSGINAIYASQYKRTQQTVQPLAEKLNIPVVTFDTKKTPELVKQILHNTTGRTIFIA
jgi:hypothetical protein